MNAATSLPTIIRYLDSTSSDGAICPHCGATGKVVHRFEVEDGRVLGAMSGCIQLFPAAPIAHEHMRLAQKARDRVARGMHLSKADQDAIDAIEAYYTGQLSMERAMAAVRAAKSAARAWMARRGWR